MKVSEFLSLLLLSVYQSNMYLTIHLSKQQAAFYGIIICGLTTLRACIGPLNIYVCATMAFLNNMTKIYGGIIITAITILRFLFVVVWKSYRQMDDDLIAWIIVIQAGVITLLVNLSNIFGLSGQYSVSNP